jgi:hypothetical protein
MTMTLSKEQAYQVRMARWEGWRRLAKHLPNHHILAVELLRTRGDQTAAVFTVVKHHEPIQYIVRGDSRGRIREGVRQAEPGGKPEDCDPKGFNPHAPGPGPRMAGAMALMVSTEEPVDANSIAMGEPPPKEPPPPGVIALASVMLASAFDVGEQVPTT